MDMKTVYSLTPLCKLWILKVKLFAVKLVTYKTAGSFIFNRQYVCLFGRIDIVIK